jgi:hypothetical protein
MEASDPRENQFYEYKRASETVAAMGHKAKRAVLQDLRSRADATPEWVVVPAGISLGTWAAFHLLHKRRGSDDSDDDGSP